MRLRRVIGCWVTGRIGGSSSLLSRRERSTPKSAKEQEQRRCAKVRRSGPPLRLFAECRSAMAWPRAFVPFALFVLACSYLGVSVAAAQPALETTGEAWVTRGADGAARVQLWFFWSKRCPHCLHARPWLEALPVRHPWIELHSLELLDHPEHIERYVSMAAALGQEARSVPAFVFCGQMRTGFDSPDTTGRRLMEALEACRSDAGRLRAATPGMSEVVDLPLVGETNAADLSLPVLTLVLAGLDSFNPCAFFVLLFLLSMLVHAGSRGRMLAIGGIFVTISGVVYFLFMAAWLNLFLVIGELEWVTLGAGLLAVLMGGLNVKDYFWFKRGVSLSIPEAAKPGLFQRMRGLLRAESLPAMVLGTLVLAVVANSYELLCTAGFPMVFTRVLTLSQLPASGYYGYLVLYNLVYVIPLAAIVALFARTLGSRKLSEHEGRILKLVSGLMMLELGLVLTLAPSWLNSLLTAVVLLGLALGVSYLLVKSQRQVG